MKLNLLFTMSLLFMLLACQEDPVSSQTGQAKIALSVRYISSISTLKKQTTAKLIDTINITRARFLIRNVKLRSAQEDSLEFLSDPYIVDLDLNGNRNNLAIQDIPVGAYDRIDFRIHRLDDDDPRDLAYFQHPDFQDFVQENRYSMIIEGIISEDGKSSESFTFRSRESEKQRHFLNPLIIVEPSTNQVTVTLEINDANWFLGDDGSLLDPRDESNENDISDNLKQSIRIFKDNSSGNSSDDNSDDNNDDSY